MVDTQWSDILDAIEQSTEQASTALRAGDVPHVDTCQPPTTLGELPREHGARAQELLIALNALHDQVEQKAQSLRTDLDALMQRRRVLTAYTVNTGHAAGTGDVDEESL